MRRDVLLLAAICCSLLDRCAARMRMRKEGHSTAPGPQNRSLRRGPEVLRKYVEIDRAISSKIDQSLATSVGCGAEQLNLLRRATLLLGYMILQQLFNVGAECTSILLS